MANFRTGRAPVPVSFFVTWRRRSPAETGVRRVGPGVVFSCAVSGFMSFPSGGRGGHHRAVMVSAESEAPAHLVLVPRHSPIDHAVQERSRDEHRGGRRYFEDEVHGSRMSSVVGSNPEAKSVEAARRW